MRLALLWLIALCACGPDRPVARRPVGSESATQRVQAATDRSATALPPAPLAAPPNAARTEPKTERLMLELPEVDVAAQRAIDAGELPGCVVAIGRSDGLWFLRAYGSRALVPQREPMTEDTIFDLASVTKAVATATAAFTLIDRGALSLDTRVSEVLPEVAPAARAITVRDLLLHTSGLPKVIPLSALERDHEQALASVLELRPERPRGQYSYGDIGFIWLGEIVARLAKQPLDAYVHARVLEPLGMRDSSFRPDAALRTRIAPTEITDRREVPLIHGEVHDPRAYRLGGVAGNAGLFATATDLARYARMLLGEGSLEGTRVLSPEAVAAMTTPQPVRDPRRAKTLRTPGFDAESELSRARGSLLGPRAYGHGGHTGTALWIDPDQDLFVIVLSNRVHPDGRGNVIALEAAIMDAAVRGVARSEPCPLEGEPVLAGIDRLRAGGFARLAGKRLGLLTHRAARARDGKTTLELLAAEPSLTLAAVLTPEHGLDVDREGVIASASLPADKRAIPVHSLFGPTRRPTAAMLRELDVLVVDLVDVGTRFYTYASTLRECLVAAADAGLPVLVLDRPNPLGGRVEGPMLQPGLRSFVNYHPLPLRHGLTLGELARLLATELDLHVKLELEPVQGWHRGMLFDDTGWQWTPPSPNLRSFTAALLYPAVGMLEGTELSVGRGTDTPFQLVGAPFIDGEALARELRALAPPGVGFARASFTPTAGPFRNTLCHGVRVELVNGADYCASCLAFALARGLIKLYAGLWKREDLIRLLGDRKVLAAIERGASLESIRTLASPDQHELFGRRADILRYPTCRPRYAEPSP